MPKEFIKEFIGKTCSIVLFGEAFGITAKVISVEENWLKIEQKNNVRLINGDMIIEIIALDKK